MFKLDDNLLIELGLGSLPPAEKNRMLGHIYETLEMRVGMKLAQKMTNEQLDEFEAFIDRNDEAGALKWLETNFPDYKQVVANELESLKNEIKAAAPQIVAASQQPAATQPASPALQPVTQPSFQPAPQTQPLASVQAPMPSPVASQPAPQPQYPAPPMPTPSTYPQATGGSMPSPQSYPAVSQVPSTPAGHIDNTQFGNMVGQQPFPAQPAGTGQEVSSSVPSPADPPYDQQQTSGPVLQPYVPPTPPAE